MTPHQERVAAIKQVCGTVWPQGLPRRVDTVIEWIRLNPQAWENPGPHNASFFNWNQPIVSHSRRAPAAAFAAAPEQAHGHAPNYAHGTPEPVLANAERRVRFADQTPEPSMAIDPALEQMEVENPHQPMTDATTDTFSDHSFYDQYGQRTRTEEEERLAIRAFWEARPLPVAPEWEALINDAPLPEELQVSTLNFVPTLSQWLQLAVGETFDAVYGNWRGEPEEDNSNDGFMDSSLPVDQYTEYQASNFENFIQLDPALDVDGPLIPSRGDTLEQAEILEPVRQWNARLEQD